MDKQKAKDKKVKDLDEQFKAKSRDLQMMKMQANIFSIFTVLAVMGILSNAYDGFAIAKIPFTPIPLIQGLTHRGLSGNDMTECTFKNRSCHSTRFTFR